MLATDGGGRSGFIMVRVKVADSNDNAPKFLIREYKATIPSNLTTHSGFLKVGQEVCDQCIFTPLFMCCPFD